MRKVFKQSDREELIAAVRGGATVPEVARRLGVAMSTAYKWVRRSVADGVPSAPSAAPRFIELVTAGASSAALVVRVGAAEIEVRSGFDAALLRAVVSALEGGAA